MMLTYSNKLKHDSHGFTPNQARDNQHSVDVKINLEMKAKRTRTYPDLDVDDTVKMYQQKHDKVRTSSWFDRTYAIESISVSHNQKFYKLEGLVKEYMWQ